MSPYIPYCGPPPAPGDVLAAWNFDLIPIALIVCLILGAFIALQREGYEPRRAALAGVAGLGLAIAFISPLCALTVALFSARTLHHIILICIVAPALAVFFRRLRLPEGASWPAFIAVSAALWAWHIPAIYTAAWNHHSVYWALQLLLLGSGWAFWASILAQASGAGRLRAAAMIAAFAGQMGLIGAILTLSNNILYSEHILLTDVFGLSAYGDQWLAGLVMWVPGMAPLAFFAALLIRQGWREMSA